MQTFVPKARRPKFELQLRILDLNNVPLVSGTCFVKWDLPSSTAAEHRGRTTKCVIKDHKVAYDYEKSLPVRLVIGKDQMLQETWIHLEVLQEYSSAGKGERIVLGSIKLNLAEYVEPSEHSQGKGEEGVTRRYLMQDSKINSTLKIGISMKHLEGDKNYYAPPLRTAPVFGGIAGIISQEATDALDGLDQMPSLSSKSRETGEMQDMYRRVLAASWVAQPGELKADDCVEDIFAGGDGWGSHTHSKSGNPLKPNSAPSGGEADSLSDEPKSSTLMPHSHNHKQSPGSKSSHRFGHRFHHKDKPDRHKAFEGWGRDGTGIGKSGMTGTFGGRSSLHQQALKMERDAANRKKKPANEVDEFNNDYREDMRSWKVEQSEVA